MENPKEEKQKNKKYISQSDVPAYSLKHALKVIQAINDNYGKDPTKPLRVAEAMGVQPGTGPFRMVCGTSIAYGLTEGGYNADLITITPLGRRIVSPTKEGDDLCAKREAILKPRVLNDFFSKYNNEKLPTENIACNVLEEMGVPKDRTKKVLDLILENAEYVGFLKDINGKKYIDLDNTSMPINEEENENKVLDQEDKDDTETKVEQEKSSAPTKPQLGSSIFLAHGKNKKALEKLKTILSQFNIPFKIVVEEPNLGRPISDKVRETMHECNCAILLFTADEQFQDMESKTIWRPSENVVYELGACNYLYDNRVVIIKDEKVQFPSNFKDLGYISFADDNLNEKAMDLVKELIGFGILKIST